MPLRKGQAGAYTGTKAPRAVRVSGQETALFRGLDCTQGFGGSAAGGRFLGGFLGAVEMHSSGLLWVWNLL